MMRTMSEVRELRARGRLSSRTPVVCSCRAITGWSVMVPVFHSGRRGGARVEKICTDQMLYGKSYFAVHFKGLVIERFG